jgi:hypothetical protein
VAEKEKQRTSTIRRTFDMCYRNGYGHTCDCCGKNEEPRKMSQREMAQAQAVMEFLKIWNEMISAVRYDDRGQMPFMIAITPGEPMKVITEDQAEEFLPCFGDDEVIEIAPDLDLVISYDRQLLFKIGEQKYLDGPALIYAVDEEGDIISLTASDIYLTQQMIENRTMYVEEEDEKMPVLSLN